MGWHLGMARRDGCRGAIGVCRLPGSPSPKGDPPGTRQVLLERALGYAPSCHRRAVGTTPGTGDCTGFGRLACLSGRLVLAGVSRRDVIQKLLQACDLRFCVARGGVEPPTFRFSGIAISAGQGPFRAARASSRATSRGAGGLRRTWAAGSGPRPPRAGREPRRCGRPGPRRRACSAARPPWRSDPADS